MAVPKYNIGQCVYVMKRTYPGSPVGEAGRIVRYHRDLAGKFRYHVAVYREDIDDFCVCACTAGQLVPMSAKASRGVRKITQEQLYEAGSPAL